VVAAGQLGEDEGRKECVRPGLILPQTNSLVIRSFDPSSARSGLPIISTSTRQ
jgi:hypothetical protein